MPGYAVVVIGASAGGLEALSEIVGRLSQSLPACIAIVVHSSSTSQGVLPLILQRVSRLPVKFAEKKSRIGPGQIYVAPGDFHLLVADDNLVLRHGPRENGFRPAIDPLFRTAARAFGPRVVGVILSGALSDGTYGLSAVKHHGGIAIVQDPRDAIIPRMPQSAIDQVDVDSVLPAALIAQEIERHARRIAESSEGRVAMSRGNEPEPQHQGTEIEIEDMKKLFGPPSGLTCPDCGGALWQAKKGRAVRYQCHVGHQYAPENLEAAQRDEIDSALWSAVRVLEEHAELKERMAQRAADGGLSRVSEGFAEGARDARQQVRRIRTVLFSLGDTNGARTAPAARERKIPTPRPAGERKSKRTSVSRRGSKPRR